jgi:hypothetical protein
VVPVAPVDCKEAIGLVLAASDDDGGGEETFWRLRGDSRAALSGGLGLAILGQVLFIKLGEELIPLGVSLPYYNVQKPQCTRLLLRQDGLGEYLLHFWDQNSVVIPRRVLASACQTTDVCFAKLSVVKPR